MTRRKELRGPGRCVYCLQDVELVTSDHVIPLSWFSASTPEDTELPQAPACKPCNKEWGRIETGVREQLGFGVDPYILGGEGIGDKSLRSIDPSKGKGEKDTNARLSNMKKFRERVKLMTELPEDKILLPNIGQLAPGIDGEYLVDDVDPVVIGKVTKKWIKGMTYHFTNAKYIDPKTYVIQSKRMGQEPPHWMRAGGLRQRLEIGPGVIIERMYVADEPVVSFWIFQIWGKYEFLGGVVRLDHLLESGKRVM